MKPHYTHIGPLPSLNLRVILFALALLGGLQWTPLLEAATKVSVFTTANGLAGLVANNQTRESIVNAPTEIFANTNSYKSVAQGSTYASGAAWGRAEVGRLSFYATGTADGQIRPGNSGIAASQGKANAIVSWNDTFIVDGGPALFGQLGQMTITLVINGGLTVASETSQSASYFRLNAGVSDSYGADTRITGGTMIQVGTDGKVRTIPMDGTLIGPGVVQKVVRFHFGRPTYVRVMAEAGADARATAAAPGTKHGQADSNFNRSVLWGGIRQLGLVNGQPVTSFKVTSTSGYNYVR